MMSKILNAAAIILVSIFFLGCGGAQNSSRDDVVIEDVFNPSDYDRIGRIENVFVYVESSFSQSDKDEAVRQVRKQTEAWQGDWRRYVETISIYVADRDVIPCGDRPGRFDGCFTAPRGPIRVIFRGGKLHALYHEYCHWALLPDHDLEHQDARWESTWEPRMIQLMD